MNGSSFGSSDTGCFGCFGGRKEIGATGCLDAAAGCCCVCVKRGDSGVKKSM